MHVRVIVYGCNTLFTNVTKCDMVHLISPHPRAHPLVILMPGLGCVGKWVSFFEIDSQVVLSGHLMGLEKVFQNQKIPILPSICDSIVDMGSSLFRKSKEGFVWLQTDPAQDSPNT